MNKKLIILPFDHRTSLGKEVLKVSGSLEKYKEKITDLKEIIFEGFLEVYKNYKNKGELAILVDEDFGLPIINEAKKREINLCLPVEKSGLAPAVKRGQSGSKEFDFQFGGNFGGHIKKIKPDYVKVLVRYNPLNKETNKRQLVKLQKLGDFCKKNKYKLIFELLVPPIGKDLKEKNYDIELRLQRTIEAIMEIKEKVKPDIWKMEGFSKSGWKKIINVINKGAKIIVLGRGEDEGLVKKWLEEARGFEEIIGFAIGRTIFLKALIDYKRGKISKEEAVEIIKNKFLMFINFWKKKFS